MKSCPTWVHRFAVVTAGGTLLLLCAGALVTGTGSGLSVPDWPLSYGRFFPPMIGGVLFEHGHRMVAGTVAILMIFLAVSLWLNERRAWVRYLALAGVGVVFCQATLGGLTVLLRLPKPVSIAHACLAQLFFSITVVLAVVTSPGWEAPTSPLRDDSDGDLWVSLPSLALVVSVGFFCQLLLGATVRHMNAGLAIPDFPKSFGAWIPPVFTPEIAVHFAHRVGAFTMLFLTVLLVVRTLRERDVHAPLKSVVGLLATLVSVQIVLGASVIWLRKPVPLTTIHLAVGACCLAVSIVFTCRAFRLRAGESAEPLRFTGVRLLETT